jgi:hypothetical protein
MSFPRSRASGSSFAQNAQNPPKPTGVDLVVDAHPFPEPNSISITPDFVRRRLVVVREAEGYEPA